MLDYVGIHMTKIGCRRPKTLTRKGLLFAKDLKIVNYNSKKITHPRPSTRIGYGIRVFASWPFGKPEDLKTNIATSF